MRSWSTAATVWAVFCAVIPGHAIADTRVFEDLRSQEWEPAFSDPCTEDWRTQWFLDGRLAEVRNDDEGMTIDTAQGYAVLWTKSSFTGDVRIEYDFKRVDAHNRGVNILYIQATGDGQQGCVEDITPWADRRTGAAMSDYYQNMHTYHISYATDKTDYIRGRRYLPLANLGLKGTMLAGDYTKAGLFNDQQWIHVTVIKQAKNLWIEFRHPDRTLLCHFENTDKPAITRGRIGLRLMPRRMSRFKNVHIYTPGTTGPPATRSSSPTVSATRPRELNAPPWRAYAGQSGPSKWRCHVIQPDPDNDGPDGINLHDWDGDGDLDAFVNAEEGAYSRLYFNPGPDKVRKPWTDYIEFKHGPCEDSGMGDLDNDGDIDYIANGGWIYFNPGKTQVRKTSAWTKMTLFDHEQRVPTVVDIDGDGLLDLVVGAQAWYRQPKTGKHRAANWIRYPIGKNRWPMNCILHDIDGDGEPDMVVPDRGVDICWYTHPGRDQVTNPWPRNMLHPHHEPMFMTIADVNGDHIDDVVITGGSKGDLAGKLIILLRKNQLGNPIYQEVIIDQPCGNFPKGVTAMDLDGDPAKLEILVIPKQGDIWSTTYAGDSMDPTHWQATPLRVPGADTRKKMDHAWTGDLDADGDLDVVTTEENGGWGVIWFENPLIQ